MSILGRIRRLGRRRGEMQTWAYAYTPEERRTIAGPFDSSAEAQAFCDSTDLEDPKFFRLPTGDRARATAMIKAKLMQMHGHSDDALRRVRHDQPEEGGGSSGSDSIDAEPEKPRSRNLFSGDALE